MYTTIVTSQPQQPAMMTNFNSFTKPITVQERFAAIAKIVLPYVAVEYNYKELVGNAIF